MQAFINMGVNLGLLPTKGLTLPLMSYGGSGVLINCVGARDPAAHRLRKPRAACGEAAYEAHCMIMAAGTGGHIFPGLAIAQTMQRARLAGDLARHAHGMERDLVPQHGIEMDTHRLSPACAARA